MSIIGFGCIWGIERPFYTNTASSTQETAGRHHGRNAATTSLSWPKKKDIIGKMKKLLKLFGVGVLTLVLVLAASGFLLLRSFGKAMCGNEIFQEAPFPDNSCKAVVFQPDCGATTGFSTQVSILGTNAKLSNEAGNILIMDGHPDWTEVQVSWEADDLLIISHNNGYEIFSRKPTFRKFFTTINIEYLTLAKE